MRQKRRALHEKRRKPGQSDIPHRKLRVHPAPLVRQARAGPSDTLDQIIEKAHRIVESELDPKHKRLFRKIGAIAKMRIAAIRPRRWRCCRESPNTARSFQKCRSSGSRAGAIFRAATGWSPGS